MLRQMICLPWISPLKENISVFGEVAAHKRLPGSDRMSDSGSMLANGSVIKAAQHKTHWAHLKVMNKEFSVSLQLFNE